MKSQDRKLALVGLVSLAIYVLACRPAFSPDGSKILLTAGGGTNELGHILLYDRTTTKWSTLLTVGRLPGGDSVPLPTAVWAPDGRSAVAAWGSVDEHNLMVAVLPVGGQAPTRVYTVEHEKEALLALITPLVLYDHYLLLGGESITVLNLETGETVRQKLADNEATNAPRKRISLVGRGHEVYYLLGGNETLEVGRLELEGLRPLPLIQLKTGTKEGFPFLAISRTGSRIAFTTSDDQGQTLRIYRQFAVERTLTFGTTNQPTLLGDLVWSPDGNTLYAAGFKPLKPGPVAWAKHAGYQALRAAGMKTNEPRTLDVEVLACEIPLDGKPYRETPLFRIASDNDETFLAFYQLALSPDGKTVAFSAGLSEEDDTTRTGDRALYLLDLTRARRPVSKIHIPRAVVLPARLFSK